MNNINSIIIKSHLNVGDKSIPDGLYTFLNPYSYLLCRNRIDLRTFDYIGIDGISFIIIMKLFQKKKIKRYSFDMSSVAPFVFNYAINKKKSIYIIGTKKGTIDLAINNIKSQYNNVNIIGYSDGYLNTEEKKNEIIQIILNKKPDIVIVGMGTPKQEEFLLDIKNKGWSGIGFTCGGFLHQTAKGLSYYPKIFDKLNIRWVYRIIDEPKLMKRYFVSYPIGIIYIVIDIIKRITHIPQFQ